MAIHVDDPEAIQNIVDSIAVRITGPSDDIYFNKKDMIEVLNRVSREITNEDQQEGFLLAVQFLQRMEQ